MKIFVAVAASLTVPLAASALPAAAAPGGGGFGGFHAMGPTSFQGTVVNANMVPPTSQFHGTVVNPNSSPGSRISRPGLDSRDRDQFQGTVVNPTRVRHPTKLGSGQDWSGIDR